MVAFAWSGDEIKIFLTAKATEILMLNKTDWDKFAAATGARLEDLKTWEDCWKILWLGR